MNVESYNSSGYSQGDGAADAATINSCHQLTEKHAQKAQIHQLDEHRDVQHYHVSSAFSPDSLHFFILHACVWEMPQVRHAASTCTG